MFASPNERATVQHSQIQAGTLLPDEARADNGRPPLPDGLGQIPQVTPVGGAPNPAPLPTAEPAPEEPQKASLELAVVEAREQRDTLAVEMREGLLALAAGLRDHKPTPVQVDVHVPEPRAFINVEASTPDVIVHVPELAAPIVNVQPAQPQITVESAAPVVHVDARAAEQPAPIVNVAVEPTPVTVESVVHVPKQERAEVVVNVPEQRAPDIYVETAPVTIENRVPEMAAPVVNVTVEPTPVTVEAPVTVNVPEAAPPIVMVENTIESPTRRIKLQRDAKGNLQGAIVEEDAG
jgi:hypothetical protein